MRRKAKPSGKSDPVIAKVIVDLSLDREFDYIVPPDLAGNVLVGSRVQAYPS